MLHLVETVIKAVSCGCRLSADRVLEKIRRKVVAVRYRKTDYPMLYQRLHLEDLCRGRRPGMCH